MSFPPLSRYLLPAYMMESPATRQLGAQVSVAGVRLSLPLVVGWLVTTQCQLHCQHCWVEAPYPQASPAEQELIARRLAAEDICRVCLSGGEVTLLPELGRLVRILKEGGIPLSIYTNALAVGRKTPRGRHWLDHWDGDIDYAQVSLDGGNCEDFEAQRGKGTFAPFLKGIKFLRQHQVRLLARYIATPFNRADVHGAARLAMELGCEGFAGELFQPAGRAAAISLEDTLAAAQAFNASLETMLRDRELMSSPMQLGICFPNVVPLPVFFRDSSLQAKPLRRAMQNGTAHCFVLPSGDIFPATYLADEPAYFCGSLLHDDLDNIWREGAGFQKMPRVRDLSQSLCASCPDFCYCQGGSEERAFRRFGTFNAHDPHCHFCRERPGP
jgi:radical SAM protein with 4Fe4S-binding SPASM domain